jgi:hypothetical protein
MERRTVTPAPRRVTEAFSATAVPGQRSASVLDAPAGTVVDPTTELGTTTFAAEALAGPASNAIVIDIETAILGTIARRYHRFAQRAPGSILAPAWVRSR